MKKVTTLILVSILISFSTASFAAHKKRLKHPKTKAVTQRTVTNTVTTQPPEREVADTAVKSPAEAEIETPPKKIGCMDNEITGNFTITSNYLFRGLSQSNNLPAFQGGLTWTFLYPGIYFNVWGSNVNMPSLDGLSTATVEIDTVAGIKNDIGEHFNYNLSFSRYNYPKATDLNYNEFIAVLTYRIFIATIGYSNNVFNSGDSGTYYNGGVSIPMPSNLVYFDDVNICGSVGHYSLPAAAGNSYNDYNLCVNKKIKNYTLALQWTDTNHKFYNNSLDQAHVVGSVTVDF